MNAPAHLPRSRRSPRASAPEIKRLIKAARDAGLDPAGFEAFPDGTVRVFTAAAAARPDLFEQMEREGKI
jgi:hypothetical protein